MKKIAIDLTWVRHNQVGGTEASIRNLLDGFYQLEINNIKFVLLTSQDNYDSFLHYANNSNFEVEKCDVYSCNQKQRVLWQNFKMGRLLRKRNISICLEPVYGKPVFGCYKIAFYTIIHDLQALHYPEYFSRARVAWMKFEWWVATHTSKKIIAISEYVRNDILEHFSVRDDAVITIYDAIDINYDDIEDASELDKYGVSTKHFYYTVSSLLPHKNLDTLIKALARMKDDKMESFLPLVVSGVGGKSKQALLDLCSENHLENDVILTPFVSDAVRNRLYKDCRLFLYPSIFEGFGMPPIEAMALGTAVVTTRETSIEEVTDGYCAYVDTPMDEKEWQNVIDREFHTNADIDIQYLLRRYDKKEVAMQYVKLWID